VESRAEDIIDYAREGKRARVAAAAAALASTARGRAATDLRKAGVPEDRIALLADRARLVDGIADRAEPVRISLAANQVSALMPEFYARYADPVPPEVLKLDYLDREAELRSLAGDKAGVRGSTAGLSDTWTGLRPRVARLDRRLSARFTRHVAAMGRLSPSSPALRKEAATGLALVDRLESAFRRG
jgi:hypothetical protein